LTAPKGSESLRRRSTCDKDTRRERTGILVKIMANSSMRPLSAAVVLLPLLLGACGGGGEGNDPPPLPPPTYTVGGTVSGLAGSGLTLQNNGGPGLQVAGGGNFAFPAALQGGAAYSVTVQSQPGSPTQTCAVANATGTVVTQNVTNVAVTCVTNTYSIGGTVSGLAGSGLVLKSALGGEVAISANGAFTLPSAVASGATYDVLVLARPAMPSQTCTVADGDGTIGATNITNVKVTCSTDAFSVGGTVTGLNGSGLILRINGASDLTIVANGAFAFPQTVLSGAAYNVTIVTQPSSPAQKCAVQNATGGVSGGNVSNVSITCTNIYGIGGTVTGLVGSGLVLRNAGGDDTPIPANGVFTFQTLLPPGSVYNV